MIKGLPTASKGTRHLYVHRRLSSPQKILVGQLAQNSSGIFFQYDDAYLSQYHSLSPFTLPFNPALNKAEKNAAPRAAWRVFGLAARWLGHVDHGSGVP